jgi:HEAT repeat protein
MQRTLWIVGVLGLATVALAGRNDLATLWRKYRNARDVDARRAAVEQLGECDDKRTIGYVDQVARLDPNVGVRATAVRVLGARSEPTALQHLLEFTVDGGVEEIRRACSTALAEQSGAVKRVRAAFSGRRVNQLDRLRLIDALGGVPTLDAYGFLVTLVEGKDPALRGAALRAIARHEVGREEIGDTLVDALRNHHDVETIVTVLDLVEDHALERWPDIAPLVERRTETAVEEAAITLEQRHAFVEAMRLAEKKEAEGYALDRSQIPEEPQPRTRLDVVYAFDATGSTVGQIEQVKAFITEHAGPLVMVRHDARVGIVAYRVGEKATPRTRTEVLPLTHDVDAAIAFVNGIDQRGADSRGAAVADAVQTALDRMPWRPNARRQVYVLADGRIDDRPRAWRTARQHHESDGTQLSVWYWSNTRQTPATDLERLAEEGGGTFTLADPPPPPGTLPPGTGGPAPTGR